MQEATTFLQADGELSLSSNAAIVLSPGSKTGGSGYTGVAIEGSITEGTWEGDVIDIAHGGTGASTAAQARANLGISTGTSATSGTWTPTVYGATVSKYTSRTGWYVKVGSVVTVGWYLYCVLDSGQTDTQFQISGLPFTPSSGGSGGGHCSGYYSVANSVFSGWELNSAGRISGRVQKVSTSDGTRWAGSIYCGTEDMTTSGTITYTI
jgi:hypothetical protein